MNDLRPPTDPAWLVADIGGTNARFAWVDSADGRPQHVRTLEVAQYAGLADAARAYLAELDRSLGSAYRPPEAGAFAVATAVGQDEVRFTNSGWAFSVSATQTSLGFEALHMLNDFEALALSLPRLSAEQKQAIGPALPTTAGGTQHALAVVGPGTGLGVAGLLPSAQGWLAIPGEGGHATLAAADDFEAAVLAAARTDFPHVSAERLLSGIGLPTLHAAVCTVLGQPKPGAERWTAQAIVEAAHAGQDGACTKTVQTFGDLLGSFAGSVALMLGARGGVYIGGGIVPRLGSLFDAVRFRQRFEAKGRFQPYLAAVPTWLITDTLVALSGAVAALDQAQAAGRRQAASVSTP